jgi:hypothetical protein
MVIAYVAFMHGFWVRNYLKGDDTQLMTVSLTVLWGLCLLFFYSAFLLFFIPASVTLILFYGITAILIHFLQRKKIAFQVKAFLFRFSRSTILFFCLFVFALLIFSAQPSRISDDGLYYTQTVMWLNEFGFIKGISNLMMPLGLTSSWHIIQAVFSFDFIDGFRFNDLNGFLMVVVFFYYVERQVGQKQAVFFHIAFALTLLVSVPFLTACSPDLPVIVFTLIGCDLWYRSPSHETLYDLVLLAAFAISIKLSAILIFLIPFGYTFSYYKVITWHRKRFAFTSIFFCSVLLILLLKNVYLTGYPLFPFHFFVWRDLPWTTPETIMAYYEKGLKIWAVADIKDVEELKAFRSFNLLDGIRLLTQRSGYKKIINWTILLSAVGAVTLTIVYIYRSVKKSIGVKPVIIFGLLMFLNFLVWLELAPQYRFILPLVILNVSCCLYHLFHLLPNNLRRRLEGERFSQAAIGIVSVLSLVSLAFVPEASDTIFVQQDFQLSNIIRPHTSYHFTSVDSVIVNDQVYYRIKNNYYCWDCPLPCIPLGYSKFLGSEGGYAISKLGNDVTSGFTLTK